MPSSFTTTHRVEFCETDAAGIAHFSNFYRWMEQAEHAFFRSLGLTIMNKQGDGTVIGWPRVSARCRFESPARFEDEVEVRLRVARRGVRSLTYSVEFWRDATRLATGEIKTVCCLCRPNEPLESIDIPDEYAGITEAE